MKKYKFDFYEEVWGFVEVKAKTKQEALDRAQCNDYDDRFDNKSNFEITER